jgi:hypothetical protein
MMQLEKLWKKPKSDLLVIKAHAAGPQTLFVALEVFEYEKDTAASCIVSVDLASLAVELVYETSGSSVDYAYRDGWHGLLQRDAVIELGSKTPIVTRPALGTGGWLAAIQRSADTTWVAGTKQLDKYAIDGFVARVANGKLAMVLETSKHECDPGSIAALEIGGSGRVYAAGSAMAGGRRLLFTDGVRAPVSEAEIYAVHETVDKKTVLVGAREAAAIVTNGSAQAASGVVGRVRGITEFRGVEYWMSHDGADFLRLSKRTGTKLAKKYQTKFHYIGYRELHHAPDARMTSSDDMLVVSNRDRIHIFDGKKWSQLVIQRDAKKLVKRLPPAMK